MLPKAIPELTEKQFKFLEEEMQRKPSKRDTDRLGRVLKTFDKHPL